MSILRFLFVRVWGKYWEKLKQQIDLLDYFS